MVATWQTYSAPFTISTDGSTVVEYYSKDTAGNTEGVKSYTVKIDRQAPSSSSGVSSRTVTLTASDANSGVSAISYRIGSSGIWTKYSSPFVAGVSGENVVVYYYAVDNAGNTETTRSVQVGTADSTAPSTSVGLTGTLGKNGWYVSGVIVKLTSTDNVAVKSTYYRWQGTTSWYTYSGSITTYTEGDRVLEYYSVDSVGNIEATKSTHVKISTVLPQHHHHGLREHGHTEGERPAQWCFQRTISCGWGHMEDLQWALHGDRDLTCPYRRVSSHRCGRQSGDHQGQVHRTERSADLDEPGRYSRLVGQLHAIRPSRYNGP